MSLMIEEPALQMFAAMLAGLLESRKLPHAVLFTGGTKALRRAGAIGLASALLCSGVEPQQDELSLFAVEERVPSVPCGTCLSCRKIAEQIHPDVVLIEGDVPKSFHIEEIRNLRRTAYVLPNESDKKVYVLHNAQTMTPEAQNALLKLLEEPPDFVCLILTAPARHMLLETVLSRSFVLSYGETTEEPAEVSEEASELQAERFRQAEQLTEALASRQPWALLQGTAALEKDREALREILPLVRVLLVERMKAQPALFERLTGLVEGVRSLESALERNANQNLLATRLAALGMAGRFEPMNWSQIL